MAKSSQDSAVENLRALEQASGVSFADIARRAGNETAAKAMDFDREKGIEAIIFLQAHVGITEPRDKAERGWDAMSKSDRKITLSVYDSMKQTK